MVFQEILCVIEQLIFLFVDSVQQISFHNAFESQTNIVYTSICL